METFTGQYEDCDDHLWKWCDAIQGFDRKRHWWVNCLGTCMSMSFVLYPYK